MIDEYLGKKLKSNFVFGFSQNQFFHKKVQNRPRFSSMLRPIQPKFVSQILDTVCQGGYFLFQKILLW